MFPHQTLNPRTAGSKHPIKTNFCFYTLTLLLLVTFDMDMAQTITDRSYIFDVLRNTLSPKVSSIDPHAHNQIHYDKTNLTSDTANVNNRSSIHQTNSARPDKNLTTELPSQIEANSHQFFSPYVIKPIVYPSVISGEKITPEEAFRRNFTVVSTVGAPRWFANSSMHRYNIDLQVCPVKECFIDLEGKYSSYADVLLFFHWALTMPREERRPGQIWAFTGWESPLHYTYHSNYSLWRDQFNWTVGYRADSDWFFPNNLLTYRDPTTLLKEKDYIDIAKRKTKMAAWMVSNCYTHGQREKYVMEMQKYIDIDIYGYCGNLSCPRNNASHCENLLTTTYRFYLSFENSLCHDYVTEKFFRMFINRTHVIPVGRSGFDYNKYIPGNFVVDASKFKTAKDLALYLKMLANDTPRYAQMLQEKDRLVALNRKMDWCQVCERLRGNQYRNHTYHNIRLWSHNSKVCRGAHDIV